jgi:hypothetical protein|uniref:Uncharacterized protein n=1 Tax=viral metagenome TaxID=1070528 RepID=A0A6C0IJZ3_9ZZZZ
MASTRNKNSIGDYQREISSYTSASTYMTYDNAGKATTNYLAGDGLLMGRMAPENLASNACDIESQLFGIGSTNLVTPQKQIQPKIHNIKSLNVSDRISMIIPAPLVVEKDQRPYPMK